MTAAELTLIDNQVVIACTVVEAMQLLDGPDQIASWFRAARGETSTRITSSRGDCVLERTSEWWHPADQVLTVDGRIGDIHVHAHLTLMAVVHSISNGHVQHGTEIWVHAELGRGSQARRVARIITTAFAHGLEHLRLELDRSPNVG
ncbi:MAG: hypothetical protein Q8M22_07970 [Actinomycetota bacterium]|nr:hypothetical protein [Actinomycetota bacterium]